MDKKELYEVNGIGPGCMDGRRTLMIAHQESGEWVFDIPLNETEDLVEIHLPGGGLGLIAAAEKVAHLSQDEAIEAAERGLEAMGLKPQLHIDNHHGEFDLQGKTEEEIIEFLEENVEGCGFAKRTWEDQAGKLIRKLIARGWLVEVLDGHHGENEALAIDQEGMATNNQELSGNHNQAFTFNRHETKQILIDMGVKEGNFASDAMSWLDGEFAAISSALSEGRISEVHSI